MDTVSWLVLGWVVGWVFTLGYLAATSEYSDDGGVVSFLAVVWPATLVFIVGAKLGEFLEDS